MKKKVLLVSILIITIVIISVIIISINKKEIKPTVLYNNAIRENTLIDLATNEEIPQDTKENAIESTKENTIEITNEETRKETQKKNEAKNNERPEDISNEKLKNDEILVVNENKSNSQNNEKLETETIEKPKQTIDLSKYDRYENGLNGGYKCFKKNTSEITKLKTLIDNAISEFGYTDVSLVENNTITNTRSFTANKTNVENLTYNSEGFKIYYYAEIEYTVTADGIETEFQPRAYLKVVEK
ncbi:MAG: hypothetical protein Q4G09_07010 [Clostridia bacterium]|nr:hypothetical protein [Clostridia bacterium]